MLEMQEICAQFGLRVGYRDYEIINSGHINATYKVYFSIGGKREEYIIQRVNTYVFQDPVAVMENIRSVTQFLRDGRQNSAQKVLRYYPAIDGKYYAYMPDGSFWRCCRYVEDSVTFEQTEDLAVIEQAGLAFGEFQRSLSGYPVKDLRIVIPHFHNTVRRYQALREGIESGERERKKEAEEEIDGYLRLEEIATLPYRLQTAGILPLRVTHNDTKISNVLFHRKTGEKLLVIDLDTVMPGLIAFDFGDAIRVAAATCKEDEADLSKVAVDMQKYEAFTKGFVGAVKNTLSQAEKETLALGALAMTAECGVRFLTDYLNGDKYFRISYPKQNLVRARCHLALARDTLEKIEEMKSIVQKYCEGEGDES